MVQYILKSALVAEIKERIETYNKGYANGDDRRADALEVLLHDIDTLEVKEVDLELTWKDMKFIYEISCDVFNEQDGCFYDVSEIWKEVLKRFKEKKEK